MSRGAIPLVVTIVLLILLGVGVILGPQIVKQRTQTKSQAGETFPEIKILPSPISGLHNLTTTFGIYIDSGGKSIVGADIDLEYDPTLLQVEEGGVTPGSIFPQYLGGLDAGKKVDQEDGRISLSGLASPNDQNPPTFSGLGGLFATVTVKGLKVGQGMMIIVYRPGSTDESNLTEAGTGIDVLAQATSVPVNIGASIGGSVSIPPIPSPTPPASSAPSPLPPQPSSSPTPTPTTPPSLPSPGPINGDYNGDHAVNSLDLSVMYSNWGKNPNRADVDLNNDARINTVDYGILLKSFQP